MSIDIDKLSETELIDLNNRIVERLRFMRQARDHVAMLQFRIGQRVSFQPDGRERLFGVITRYNKKSVSVVGTDGSRWTVSPALLTPEAAEAEKPTPRENILQLPRG